MTHKPLSVTTNVVGLQTDAVVVTETRFKRNEVDLQAIKLLSVINFPVSKII